MALVRNNWDLTFVKEVQTHILWCCQNNIFSNKGSKFAEAFLYLNTELQNVISFTQSKSFRPNFTPWKVRKSRQIEDLNLMKFRWMATLKGKKVPNMASLKIKTSQTWWNLPQNYFILQKCVVSYTFYPNFPIFLHRYICHICDILQLCLNNWWKWAKELQNLSHISKLERGQFLEFPFHGKRTM